MLCRFIFCSTVFSAILVVILLAIFSPIAHRRTHSKNQTIPSLSLSLYIQQSHISSPKNVQQPSRNYGGAFTFHRTLTEGPRNTSRVLGRAQGFIIPAEKFADSAFNIIYLTVDMPEYSGSVSILAENSGQDGEERLTVVGGTGCFAFARGVAVFARTDGLAADADATQHVKLQLRFPHRSKSIEG